MEIGVDFIFLQRLWAFFFINFESASDFVHFLLLEKEKRVEIFRFFVGLSIISHNMKHKLQANWMRNLSSLLPSNRQV